MITHRPYPSDASDAEWHFVAPDLRLLPEDVGQGTHGPRDIFDSLRWMARFRRLARYCERLSTTLAGLHCVAFGMLMRRKAPHCSPGAHNLL